MQPPLVNIPSDSGEIPRANMHHRSAGQTPLETTPKLQTDHIAIEIKNDRMLRRKPTWRTQTSRRSARTRIKWTVLESLSLIGLLAWTSTLALGRYYATPSWEFSPAVATAPRRYLADLRRDTPDDPGTVNYGQLRVDRRCAKHLEALVAQSDAPWLHEVIDTAMAGNHSVVNHGPLRIECPMPDESFGGIYHFGARRIQYHGGARPDPFYVDASWHAHSSHSSLNHELHHAHQADVTPSASSFAIMMPCADRAPYLDELYVLTEADQPYHERFGLGPVTKYGGIFPVPAMSWYVVKMLAFIDRLWPRKTDDAGIIYGWNREPDRARIAETFRTFASVNVPPELEEAVVSHVFNAQTVAFAVSRGESARSELAQFEERTVALDEALREVDRKPTTFGCRKLESVPEAPNFDRFQARLGQDAPNDLIYVTRGHTPADAEWHVARAFADSSFGPHFTPSSTEPDRSYLTLPSDNHKQVFTIEHLDFATPEDIHTAIDHAAARAHVDGHQNVSLILELDSIWRFPTKQIFEMAVKHTHAHHNKLFQEIFAVRDGQITRA